MARLNVYLQLIMIVISVQRSTQSCATYSFDGSIYSLICENISRMDSVNGYSPRGVHTIHITNSTITTIPENAFATYKYELRNIMITGCDLETIEYGSLSSVDKENFPQLSTLNLSGNNIQHLQVEVFNNSKTRELNLASNNLEIIEVGAFRNMPNLRKLDLRMNRIHTLDEEGSFPLGVLQDIRTVDTINLSHNSLQDIKLGAFTGLSYLKNLDLSHNNLVVLPKGLLVDCEITELNLSYNSLVFFEYPNNDIIPNINILHNDFDCEFLAEIVNNLPKISFIKDQNYTVTNIKGVPCAMGEEIAEEPEARSDDFGDQLSLLKYITMSTLAIAILVVCYALCCKRSENDDEASEPVLKEISYSHDDD